MKLVKVTLLSFALIYACSLLPSAPKPTISADLNGMAASSSSSSAGAFQFPASAESSISTKDKLAQLVVKMRKHEEDARELRTKATQAQIGADVIREQLNKVPNIPKNAVTKAYCEKILECLRVRQDINR